MSTAVLPAVRALHAASSRAPTTALVEALRDPACYPHPVRAVEVLETHISYVLLAGEFAYKIKKPVRLAFLDFSTLEARRRCCREELRLNRRTAPQVYLDVIAIGGEPSAPRVGAPGPALEYAVKMQRFPQEAILSHLARHGALRPEHVDALADCVARFHRAAARIYCEAMPGDEHGAAAAALANFHEIARLRPPAQARESLESLRGWTRLEADALAGTFEARAAQGLRRDGHGDLHLGNVVLLDDHPVLFDCVEFSEALRHVDVMSDAAFAAMDLARHGLPRLAARFVNRYVECTGDHAGLAVMRFYQVYRAMVRAKVACIRLRQAGKGTAAARAARAEFLEFVALARALSRTAAPLLVIAHGVSASGKTTVSQQLLEALGAVRLRSDVERKRLHGLDALARAGAAPGAGIYGERDTHDTYERLAALARRVVAAGYPVIVDATFLRRADRDRFRALAAAAQAQFHVVACTAPAGVLHARVAERSRAGNDASDAGVAVLDAQMRLVEPVGEDERAYTTMIDTGDPRTAAAAIATCERRLGAAGE